MLWETVYLVESGVLLNKEGTEDSEYDAYLSYDKKHSFYDEIQEYANISDRETIIRNMINYVVNGVPGTYGVLSITGIDPDIIEGLEYEGKTVNDLDVEGEEYLPENVVWSLYKDKAGKVHFNFIEGQQIKERFYPSKLPSVAA